MSEKLPNPHPTPSRRDDDVERASRLGVPGSSRTPHAAQSQRIIDGIKTFLWVAGITLVIWISAERQQQVPAEFTNVQIQVRSASASRVVTIVEPVSRHIGLSLTGPKASIDQIRDILTGARAIELIVPDVYPPSPSKQNIPLRDLLLQNEVFSRGLSIDS